MPFLPSTASSMVPPLDICDGNWRRERTGTSSGYWYASASSSSNNKDDVNGRIAPGNVGSWIVDYDDNGVPYWTNDVSNESTYRLLVQRTNEPGMPPRYAGGGSSRHPPSSLPLRGPSPSPEYTSRSNSRSGGGCCYTSNTDGRCGAGFRGAAGGGGGSSSCKKKGKHNRHTACGDDDDDDDDDDSGGGGHHVLRTRMGRWEEIFNTMRGTKVWYNTVTGKKTCEDPFR